MSGWPIPADEPRRLEALRRYGVVDTPAEQDFDDLARLAAHCCGAPLALVSLVFVASALGGHRQPGAP